VPDQYFVRPSGPSPVNPELFQKTAKESNSSLLLHEKHVFFSQ
jgi:hypothetical protein